MSHFFGFSAAGKSKPKRTSIQANTELPKLLRGASQNKGRGCDDYRCKCCAFSVKFQFLFVDTKTGGCICHCDAQVFDQSALSLEAKEEMYKLYPNARRAHLKTGGNFPYLCRSAEVNLYIQVRIRFNTNHVSVLSADR